MASWQTCGLTKETIDAAATTSCPQNELNILRLLRRLGMAKGPTNDGAAVGAVNTYFHAKSTR